MWPRRPFEYASLAEMVDIRLGGVGIYGAVIAAFLSRLAFACRWRKVPVLPMFDLAAMGFLLGQGIGRWGNFVNQEAFGTNTTLPWGMIQRRHLRLTSQVCAGHAGRAGRRGGPVSLPVHPTFLYESHLVPCWAFSCCGHCMKRRKFHGELMLDVCDVVRRWSASLWRACAPTA